MQDRANKDLFDLISALAGNSDFTTAENVSLSVYYPLDEIGGTTSDGTDLTLGQPIFFDSYNTFTLGPELLPANINSDPTLWTVSSVDGTISADSVNGGIKLLDNGDAGVEPVMNTPKVETVIGDMYLYVFKIADINSATVTSKGTGNIGTQIDITDVTADATNYLLLEIAQASGEQVNGGKVTIAAV